MGLLANLWSSMVTYHCNKMSLSELIFSMVSSVAASSFANASHSRLWPLIPFAGEGMSELSLADRATIANMSPEYGATMGFFPVDHVTLQYLKLTGRSDDTVCNI